MTILKADEMNEIATATMILFWIILSFALFFFWVSGVSAELVSQNSETSSGFSFYSNQKSKSQEKLHVLWRLWEKTGTNPRILEAGNSNWQPFLLDIWW